MRLVPAAPCANSTRTATYPTALPAAHRLSGAPQLNEEHGGFPPLASLSYRASALPIRSYSHTPSPMAGAFKRGDPRTGVFKRCGTGGAKQGYPTGQRNKRGGHLLRSAYPSRARPPSRAGRSPAPQLCSAFSAVASTERATLASGAPTTRATRALARSALALAGGPTSSAPLGAG